MTIKAIERGRKLIIDIGEEGEDGFIRLAVAPINAKLGAALYALWAGIAFGQSEQPEVDGESMGRLAIGQEHWPVIDSDLRWNEAELVIHAAFFWNVQGGGIDLVNTLLNPEQGGYPKAQGTLLERNGHSKAFEALKTLLNSGVAPGTHALEGTSDTSTPSGSETLSKLPASKRSINQNQPPTL